MFHELPQPEQVDRARVAAHYLCELAEQALVQGDAGRAHTLLRQARTHQPQLPRADMLTARIAEQAGDHASALPLYLHALETSPGLALEIIPAVLAIARQADGADMLHELSRRLQQSGGVTPRQLAWLLATAVPAEQVARLPDVTAQFGGGVDSLAEASSLGMLLTRIGDAGGRYQCDDCGLSSVRWYWRCPKCHAWDSLRPAIFKWAERAEHAVRLS